MPIKIKSRITATKRQSPAPDTPLRTGLVRSTSQSTSGLKNLSEQRDMKKIQKHREASLGKGTLPSQADSNRQIIESLVNLEQQYEHMKNTSKSRPSIKRSLANINIKGVPHTTITLKPKVANTKDSLSNVSFNSTNSRANSFTCSENQFKVVSMGSLCHRKQNKKKGIVVSLASTLRSRRFMP